MALASPNFGFLAEFDAALAHQAVLAERYCLDDPPTALVKLRLFAEMLAKNMAARLGVYPGPGVDLVQVINRLHAEGILDEKLARLFHSIRQGGNMAVHEGTGTVRDSLQHLRFAHQLAVYGYRVFKDPDFSPGPFRVPPNPTAMTDALRRQLDDFQAAVVLAQEAEDASRQEIKLYEEELASLQRQGAERPESSIRRTIDRSRRAAAQVVLTEADTRRIIDQQLRAAGWVVDSEDLRFARGVRPERGVNKAIAEWPTRHGVADYVLFCGLTAMAVVEAKRQAVDVSAAVDQAKRYSRDFLDHAACRAAGGPWDGHRVPFVFATNGRPFLRQMETASGIWFCDLRRAQNLRRPLESWYTPEGLADLSRLDLDRAEKKLDEIGFAFDFPLRAYQRRAIEAVERAIRDGRQTALIAMATGTGKTKTCIALLHRLLTAQRFRRILFLVDRTALGEQAANAFKDTEITGLQKFADIFDIKEVGDIDPERETAVQIATIQGMVKRVLYAAGEAERPKVDRFDCLVVDECHRGYLLDRMMSESELTFRSQADYISKYRRVLDYFDAVKIGLTATPALHTTDIFGPPVFTYSYREAVIDGFLADHEPPRHIETELARKGIHWKRGAEVKYLDPATGRVDLARAPDELDFAVADFNRRVLTKPFNQAVCRELARHIDPGLKEKTLVFCANDRHADLVTRLLKEAFARQYGQAEDDAVVKITGKSDQPLQLYRRFRNETLPNTAVTVDLLTTGIDVPRVFNLVFIRRVNSRILYEQMLGRATRLCDDPPKTAFRIFDAVDIYRHMQTFSEMRPVVVDPKIGFAQLEREIATLTDPETRQTAFDQFRLKLRRRLPHMDDDRRRAFAIKTAMTPEAFLTFIVEQGAAGAADWFATNPGLGALLDAKGPVTPMAIPISETPDQVTGVTPVFGIEGQPGDFIEGFRQYIAANRNRIAALKVVLQRPSDLTRDNLRELRLSLARIGYSEQNLATAYHARTNVEIAAGIVGFIRQAALGDPLLPYAQRVDAALQRLLVAHDFTHPQRQWLERIAAQMKREFIVDPEAMNRAQFADAGGFARINRVFEGRLSAILSEFSVLVWRHEA